MGEYYLGAELRNRKTNFRWDLLVVYSPAQHDFSKNFLDELNSFLSNFALPCIIRGDFNLIRCVEDKSKRQGVLTLLRALNYVPQAHGSCVAFPLEYSIQGLSIHGSAMNDLGFSI